MNTNVKNFYLHLTQELKFYQKLYNQLLEMDIQATEKQDWNITSMKRKSVADTIEELQELINIYKTLFDL